MMPPYVRTLPNLDRTDEAAPFVARLGVAVVHEAVTSAGRGRVFQLDETEEIAANRRPPSATILGAPTAFTAGNLRHGDSERGL